jgi:UDP-glucose 4-epimerase
VQRIVYASSIAAVGPCAEDSGDDVALRPLTVYGATKAAGEHLCRALSALDAYPACIAFRFGWVYGPGRKRGWRVARRWSASPAATVTLSSPTFPSRSTGLMSDAAEVLLRALAAPVPRFAVFNVVGDRRTMRDAIAHLQLRHPGVQVEYQAVAVPASGWTLRNDGLQAALGFAPATSLEDGIDAMLVAHGRDAAATPGLS